MKVSLAHHLHASRLRSGGAAASSSSSSTSCRQFFSMEAVQPQPQHQDHHQHQQQNLQQFQQQNVQHQHLQQNPSPSWWNNNSSSLNHALPSDSSIDSFHPDSSVFSSLNSDISLPSSTSPSPSPLDAPGSDGGAFHGLSSPELTPQAEVNPTSFEILPPFHAQMDDQRAEQAEDADHVDSPGELSETHGESSENCTAPDDASVNSNVCMPETPPDRPSSSEGPPSRMRLMCSYGGRITPRLVDGKLRYTGGETRIVAVKRGISFDEFMKKMVKLYGSPLGFKYQLPDEDLDALVSVSSDDDLQNMVEEYEKAESSAAGSSRIRLFFYSSPSDLDISEEILKADAEGAVSPASDQHQFVNTVNGVSEKLQNTHMEEDNLVLKQVDATNVENIGRMLPHDVPNVLTHSKSTSTLSSYPSSPQLVPRPVYTKIPDELSLSHQGVNEHLYSKPAAPGLHRFTGDLEPDGLIASPASSHFDHVYHHDPHHIDQIRMVSDSPRAPHHEFPTHRGDNWHGMQWVDSPPKHTHQSALNPIDNRIPSGAAAVDYWNDMQHPSDTLSHLEHHHRLVQQHGLQQHQHLQHPTHQTHQQHQGLQQHHPQGWPVQIDSERVDHRIKDVYKQQPHGFYQPHPLPQVHSQPQSHPASQHFGHHAVVTQERGSWSTDHRALPSRFHPVSKTNPGQIPHGLAPAPPYHMDAAPSSPRAHIHDYHHGRCSCGLQHTEVHRGITVCIDDQTQNKWSSSHTGDQPNRKHGFSGQSRLYDQRNYFADSSMWQQSSHIIGPTETDHKDQARLYDSRNHFVADASMWQQSNHLIGATEPEHREPIAKPWQHQQPQPPQPHHLHWRHAECHQSRSYMVQCHDRLVTDEVYVPSHDCHETCIGNNGNVKHIGNKGVVSHAYHDKLFEMEPGKFNVSRKAICQNMIVKDEDYFIEDGSNHVQADWDSKKVMTPFTEGIPYPKMSDISHVSTVKSLVSEEMQVNPVLPTVVTRGSDYYQNFSTQNAQNEVTGHWGMASIDRGYLDVSFQHGQNLNGRVEGLNDVHLSRHTSRSNSPQGTSDVIHIPNQTSVSHISKQASRSNSPLRIADVANIPKQTNASHISKQTSRSNSPLRTSNVANIPKQTNVSTGIHIRNQNISQQWNGIEGSDSMHIPSQKKDLINNDYKDTKMYAAHEDGYMVCPDVVMVNDSVHSTAAPMAHVQQEVSKTSLIMTTHDNSVKVPLYDKVSVNASLYDKGSATNATDFSFSKAVASNIKTQNQNEFGGLSSVPKPILIGGNVNIVTDHVDNTMTTIKEPVQVVTDRIGEDGSKNCVASTEPALAKCEDEKSEALGAFITESSSTLSSSVDQRANLDSSKDEVQEEESKVETTSKEKGSKNENTLQETTVRSPLSQAEVLGLQIIKNSDLEDLKELGSGTFGTVYHGKWRGSDVAIKRIKASCFAGPPAEQERLISDFWKEASTLGKLHHPNVVAFYGVVPDGPGGTLATVTEYMVNGSLKQVLQKKDRTIDRRKRLLIAMDAAFGMEYLHNKRIVHFDLKCENLLVNMKDAHRPICKVGDFGLSKVKHQTLISGGVRGTLPWMAPELLSGNSNKVTEKIDVYSFGIVMWELLTGEEPYANMHCGAIIRGIVDNTLRPSIPTWCDPGWRKLMEQCWSSDPTERPSFTEIALELRAIAATMNIK